MSSTRAEPRGACCAQYSDRTYRFEPKPPCIKATSVPGSRTRLQHCTHSAPLCKGRRSKPSRTSPHHPTDNGRSGTRIACRMFDIADQGPYEFLRNITPTQEGSPSGGPLPRELLKTPPSKN
ncbi:hypothetical protein EVAR_32908_1 [Eumeta japonica]|uniref:Uncharacterized protein n=1 Tax=Eumeta variegata TaxID=151549 RepID=A0A4C1VPL6_EUMVA|nr:hypothetical protein EVAR_32908_1 [Eumeta japonica]